jgi:hypothetical protein
MCSPRKGILPLVEEVQGESSNEEGDSEALRPSLIEACTTFFLWVD